jgi:hypothetical protein
VSTVAQPVGIVDGEERKANGDGRGGSNERQVRHVDLLGEKCGSLAAERRESWRRSRQVHGGRRRLEL